MATDTFAGSGNLTSPWTVVAGSFNQTGGAVYGNTGATSSYAVNTTDGVLGDQEAEVTMTPSGSGQFIGPAVRGSNAAFTCANVDAGSDGVYISTWSGGTQTVVTGPLSAPAAGTAIKLRATGTGAGIQLRLYFNGAEQTGSGSPWTVGTACSDTGYTGITAYSNGTTTGASDWTGTNLGVTGPTINTQPQNATVYQGQTANFTVSATTSGGTLHYQWKDDGSNVGTDSNSYTTAATVLGDNGAQITCVVTDDNGNATSNAATLTVIPTASIAWLRG